MPTIQKFNFSWPDGVTPVNFRQWVNNLSPGERLEFDLAEARQEAHAQLFKDQGKLVVSESLEAPAHTWANADDAKSMLSDPVWERYYNRYLEETQTILTITYEEQ